MPFMPRREEEVPPPEVEVFVPSDVDLAVYAWRFEQMVELGLDEIRAGAAVHNQDFELERFRALRLAGCDPILAYDIVR